MKHSTVPIAFLVLFTSLALCQERQATIRVQVKVEMLPVANADVSINGTQLVTDAEGNASLSVGLGQASIAVMKPGFFPVQTTVDVSEAREWIVSIELRRADEVEEEVTVYAARTDKRLQDLPLRIEVLSREEIEEKMMMTPGDIVMMLNEMGGLRVQTTSPGLGAASVRIQGMRGRYTRFLSDGLPLFGQQGAGLGLLQIPPMDLGQVEVVKGTSSALYGAGAMAGVVNLVSRRPGDKAIHEFLVNRTTLRGTDTSLFLASRLNSHWSGSLLGGGHWQEQVDRDGDGWADLAGYSRGVIRPRFYWDNGTGSTALLTAESSAS